MNRRNLLSSLGTFCAFSVAGCSGTGGSPEENSCTIEHAAEGVDAIPATFDGTVESSTPVEVELRWNARTQPTTFGSPPSDIPGLEKEYQDHIYMVYEIAISNTSNDAVTIGYNNFTLEYETADIRDNATIVLHREENELDGSVDILSGGEYRGTAAYPIPETSVAITLESRNVNSPPVEFNSECDESLEIGFPV